MKIRGSDLGQILAQFGVWGVFLGREVFGVAEGQFDPFWGIFGYSIKYCYSYLLWIFDMQLLYVCYIYGTQKRPKYGYLGSGWLSGG